MVEEHEKIYKDEKPDDTILFNFRMPPAMKKRLEDYAKKHDLNASQAARRFIERGLTGL